MDLQSAAKLPFNFKIIPVRSSSSNIPSDIPFLAMFNPENIAITEGVEWSESASWGSDGTDMQYKVTSPRTFSVTLTIDGTGVNTNGVKIPVVAQVAMFRAATTTIDGTTHHPAYLIVQYGVFICKCVLTSSTITYTMFDFTGLAIRATINASFTEVTPNALGNLLSMLSSPDLTHTQTVKDGDLLPLMTYNIYKKQDYYLQVAKFNKLKNFRRLKQGTVIKFPPIGTNKKTE